MQSFRRAVMIALALIGGAGWAFAADNSGMNPATAGDTQQMGSEPPQSVPLTPAAPAASVMPIGASGDTVPAKFSARNDADDKLPVGGYRLKHLTEEQRQAIYRGIMADKSRVPTDPKVHPRVGNQVASSVTLESLPSEVTAQVPDTKDLKFVGAQDKVVLVDPVSMMVVGVLPN